MTSNNSCKEMEQQTPLPHATTTTTTLSSSASTPSHNDIDNNSSDKEDPPPPYSPFNARTRATIVLITALTGLVSPLSANMYYPSIQQVRDDLNTTQSAVTWTITAFLIAMALSPLIWSNIADQFGRKPVYAASMLIYTAGSIGCALSKSLTALIISRVIQSAGAGAVQSCGAGTISDIYPRERRGTALGIYYLGPLLGPCIGPLIGGYIGQGVGWRWVFWVLAIWGGVMCLLAIFVLPETHRRIVARKYRIQQINIPPQLSFKTNNPFTDIAKIRYPVIVFSMFHFAMIFGAYFTNATGQPLAYENIYGLSQGMSGVCFLCSGVGCVVGSTVGGRVTDLLLRRRRREIEAAAGSEAAVNTNEGDTNGIEVPAETRLGAMWVGTWLFLCGMAIVGWLIQHRLSLAGVLVLQFFIGTGMAFTFQCLGGYLIDIFPKSASSITACQNLVRSIWAAVIVQIFPTMLENIGWGWSYTIMFFLTFTSFSLMMVVVFKGQKLRQKYGPFVQSKSQ